MARGKHLLGGDWGRSAGTESLGFPLGCPPTRLLGVNTGGKPLASARQPLHAPPREAFTGGPGGPAAQGGTWTRCHCLASHQTGLSRVTWHFG